jgi:hypothetical protein
VRHDRLQTRASLRAAVQIRTATQRVGELCIASSFAGPEAVEYEFEDEDEDDLRKLRHA